MPYDAVGPSLTDDNADQLTGRAGLVATGTPEQVADVDASFTGQFLRGVLPAREAVAA